MEQGHETINLEGQKVKDQGHTRQEIDGGSILNPLGQVGFLV